VWEQIKSFYPGPTANWDHEPPLIWYVTIADLTVEQLITGVKNLVNHTDVRGNNDFPPNAGQFRDLCLTNFDWERKCHKVFTPDNKLENLTKKELAQQTGKDTLSEMKLMFGGSFK